MNVKLSYTLTKQQLLDFGEFLAAEAPAAREQLKKRKRQLLFMALIPLTVAGISFFRFFQRNRVEHLLLAIGAIAAAGFIWHMSLRLAHIIKRDARRQLERQFRGNHIPEIALDAGDGTLLVEWNGQTAILPLNQYDGCERRGDCRYLLFGSRGLCVPEEVLTPSQWEEWMTHLEHKL